MSLNSSILIPILAKATGVADSDDFNVLAGQPVTISIYPEANFAAEVGKLVKKNLDGTYDQVYTFETTPRAIELGATRAHATISGMGTYRLEFAARTAAIGATKQQLNR